VRYVVDDLHLDESLPVEDDATPLESIESVAR